MTFCQKKPNLPLSGSRVNRAAGAEGVFSPCRTVVETAALSCGKKTCGDNEMKPW